MSRGCILVFDAITSTTPNFIEMHHNQHTHTHTHTNSDTEEEEEEENLSGVLQNQVQTRNTHQCVLSSIRMQKTKVEIHSFSFSIDSIPTTTTLLGSVVVVLE